ncbi:hypothetical protein [Bradyrhizobium sp. Bra78]|uniref:hypothetical protein n=1 Tax=Bradyrhizobium sp. Bra78 TaxID=2926010 RepID=UPI0021CA3DCE|nr:hypothetical protein [Bradyrhizobium sp. Bra78]
MQGDAVRILRHQKVPDTGSFEVRFADGRPSRYFYWDDLPGRRLRSDILNSAEAEARAKELARTEREKLPR